MQYQRLLQYQKLFQDFFKTSFAINFDILGPLLPGDLSETPKLSTAIVLLETINEFFILQYEQ